LTDQFGSEFALVGRIPALKFLNLLRVLGLPAAGVLQDLLLMLRIVAALIFAPRGAGLAATVAAGAAERRARLCVPALASHLELAVAHDALADHGAGRVHD
jgi:hypothetical protein